MAKIKKVSINKWEKFIVPTSEVALGLGENQISVTVKKRLTIEEKISIAKAIVDRLVVDGVFYRVAFDDVFNAVVLGYYTNLNLDTDVDKVCDLFSSAEESNPCLENILACIEAACYEDLIKFRGSVERQCEDAAKAYYLAKMSKIGNVADVIESAGNMVNNVIKDAAQNIDTEAILKLIQ